MAEAPGEPKTTVRGTRRKAQLVDAAARLFHRHGYRNVSLDDIAAAVGVTGPALYRHFRNKHDLLVAAMDEQVTRSEAVATQALSGDGAVEERLETYFNDLATLVIDVHDAVLWMREQTHLSPEERKAFRGRIRTIRRSVSGALVEWRPELTPEEADLIAWALLALSSRTSEYRSAMDRASAARAMTHMAWAVAGCDLSAAPDGLATAESRYVPTEASRRERVLESATELFYRRGYYEVSVEDIAEASNTAIATLYQLFSGKANVLCAVLIRGSEGTAYLTAHRLAYVEDHAEALYTIWTTYLELALGPHGRLLRILTDDFVYLSDDALRSLRRGEREYLEEWVRALGEVRPDLAAGEVLARVHSTVAVLSELTQIPALRRQPHLGSRLHALAATLLRA